MMTTIPPLLRSRTTLTPGRQTSHHRCESAWNKDPVFGVIGIQSGPRGQRVHSGFHDGVNGGVRAEKQVTERAAQQIGDPPLLKVMGPVVDQMATLTEASQVLETVIARIVIEVGSGQNDAGLACVSRFFDIGPASRAAVVIAPGLTGLVVPAAIRQNADD